MKKAVYLAFLGVLLEAFLIFMGFSDPETRIYSFLIPYFLAFLVYFFAFIFLGKKEEGYLQVIVVFAIVFRLTFLFLTPVLDQDLYRVVWDAKMQHAGFSPYELQPKHYTLNYFREDWFSFVPLASLYSYHAPLVQLLAFMLSFVSLHIFVYKIFLFLLEIGFIFLLIKILGLKEMEKSDILIYAWNPLVIFELAWQGSFFFVVAFLFFLAFFFYLRKKYAISLLSATLAGAAFPLYFLTLPLFVKRLKFLPVILLGLMPFVFFYRSIFNFLLGLKGYFQFENGYLYFLFDKFLLTKYILIPLGILFIALFIYVSLSKSSLLKKSFLLVAGSLFLLPKLLPAFALLLVPFLIFYRIKALLLFTLLINLYYLQKFAQGFSVETMFALEYIPVALLFVYGFLFKENQ